MATQYPDLFAALDAPFDAEQVRERTQAGRTFQYVTARTIQNRLDDVLGPENWWADFAPAGEHSVLCRLTILLPDGRTLVKSDAGGAAGMADGGDDEKSAHSDAFKRAAAALGVSRYLYRDGVPEFVNERLGVSADTVPQARGSFGGGYNAAPRDRQDAPRDDRRDSSGGQKEYGPPKNGRQLFAWLKSQEQKHEVGLVKWADQFAKLQDFPFKMTDWNEEQVTTVYQAVIEKLKTLAHA